MPAEQVPIVPIAGGNPRLPGRYIVKLMRKHKVTIKVLAQRMNITQKRVRQVRGQGVSGNCMCLDWFEAITLTGLFSPKKEPTCPNPVS